MASPEFSRRARHALEDQADVDAATRARQERGRVLHDELVEELGG